MSIKLNAQPFDMTAGGFHFSTASEFIMNAMSNRNDQGDPVEEYEIQLIDGEDIDCDLAKAWGINQGNFAGFIGAIEGWNERQKIHYIIAVGECGYSHDEVADDPENIDIEIYRLRSMRELAEELVDEGVFGEIPEHLETYIDYDRISGDLEHDYGSVTIAGEFLLYRCAQRIWS